MRGGGGENTLPKGIPIGNLTSQLFANVYMDEFDQFVKHELRVKYYARYTDDFVIVSEDNTYLEEILPKITEFLESRLLLSLHPNKVSIRKYRQGIDFLGYVCLPNHVLVRGKTRRRIFRKVQKQAIKLKEGAANEETFKSSLNSYLGVLSHANSYKLSKDLKNQSWFLRDGGSNY